VGTPAPEGVSWDDLSAPERRDGEPAKARERILDAAYELFSKRGVRAVGTEEVLAKAEVAKSTLYRHFASKDDLVLAFLQRREQRWTRDFIEAEARRRGSTARERLLAIFDLFDDWFHRDDFEGCSFINVLLEMGDLESPLGRASAAHLRYIRSVVRTLAEEAGVQDSETFAHSWHILMKGSIVAAGEGDEQAGRRARAMGEDLLDRFLRPALNPSLSVSDAAAQETSS
jgi:AcrR family transcriptional regulator